MGNPQKFVFDPDEVARMAVACKAASEEQPYLNANDVAKRVFTSASNGDVAHATLKDAGLGVLSNEMPSRRRPLLRLW